MSEFKKLLNSLSPQMRSALARYPSADKEPDVTWGVRSTTTDALIRRGLLEPVLMFTKVGKQPFYRYKRTRRGDNVFAVLSILWSRLDS